MLAMALLSWPLAHTAPVTTETVAERKISIDFRISSWEVDSTYSNNATNLRELHKLIDETRTDPALSLDTLKVSGYASPDGSLPKNRELSLRRAVSLRDYLTCECGVHDSVMRFGENIVSWGLLREIVSDSDYPWRDEAVRIMSIGSDDNTTDNTRRMNRLKKLAGGEAWTALKRDVLPQLRSAYVVTTVVTIHQPDTIRETASEAPETTELPDDMIPAEEVTDLPVGAPGDDGYRFGLKTNAVYLAAGVTNLGAEMAVGDRWSIDLPVVYSPYTLARSYRLRFLYAQPEARYWLSQQFKGHFLGLHANIGVANVALNDDSRYQTPHGFYGAGISYGYTLSIGGRWWLELTIGAGYFFTKYDSYYNIGVPIGQRYKKGTPLNYWGIDKLGVNFVYRFGHKPRKQGKGVGR